MSKIWNVYSKNKDGIDSDRVWFQSSNIRYCECLDKDNDLKTLRVVFNNGTQYEYKNVNVKDYLFFRDGASQGKSLNQYIKGNNYEFTKLDNANIENIEGELEFRINGGVFVHYDNNKLTLKNNKDQIILETEIELNKDTFNVICSCLEAVGKRICTNVVKFEEDGEGEEIGNIQDSPF